MRWKDVVLVCWSYQEFQELELEHRLRHPDQRRMRFAYVLDRSCGGWKEEGEEDRGWLDGGGCGGGVNIRRRGGQT